jgi:AMMECR1 domain-containing protein
MKSRKLCNKIARIAILLLFFCLTAQAESLQSPLSSADERKLIQYARTVLEETFAANRSRPGKEDNSPPIRNGIFVTLVKNNQVRGCYGSLFPQGETLYAVIREFVIAAATSDFRHSPVHASELRDIVIVISFIGPIEPVSSISEIDPKTEGLLLRNGGHAAVLLPGEARTASWQIKEAKRQAGLRSDETAELFRIHTATLYER